MSDDTLIFKMFWCVDGGCRNNGFAGAYAAAAAIEMLGAGETKTWTSRLPRGGRGNPAPTSQRAELTAIIIALREAVGRYCQLIGGEKLELSIYSDSGYAVNQPACWFGYR